MCPAAECALIPAGRCGHRPLRKDRRARPHIRRRGRRPAVERSGTNALGVRRPVSAAVPRYEAPSGRGLSAQPTGGEKTVWNLSLRQRFALPPPSQREARGIHIPLRGGTHGSRPTASAICDRAGFLTNCKNKPSGRRACSLYQWEHNVRAEEVGVDGQGERPALQLHKAAGDRQPQTAALRMAGGVAPDEPLHQLIG